MPWRWTKMRKAMRDLLTDKKDPMTPSELWEFVTESRQDAAKRGNWRDSELAMTLADDKRDLLEVCRRCDVDASDID